MARAKQYSSGLAANLTMLTLAIVAGALVLVGGAALSGVYRYTRSLADDRLVEYSRLVTTHMDALSQAASQAVARAAVSRSGSLDPQTVGVDFATSAECLDRLVVVSSAGRVEAAYPAVGGSEVPSAVLARARDASLSTGFLAVRDAAGVTQVWAVRRSGWDPGHGLAARLRLDSTRELIGGMAARGGRTVSVLDEGGEEVLGAGEGRPDLRDARFTPIGEDGLGGAVDARAGESGSAGGVYAPITSFPGLAWRVVVLEPDSLVVRDTWASLVPGAVAMLVLGMAMAVVTYAASTRMMRPLKELSQRSRKAMDGAFVRPLPVTRDDEVGQVTEAFNALVLRLNALHDVTDLMARASSTDQVLEGTISALRHIVPSARAAVFLTAPAGGGLVMARASDPEGIEGMTLQRGSRSWLADAANGQGPSCPTRLARSASGTTLGRFDAAGPGGGLVVPLEYGSEHVGAIVMYQQSRELTDAEIEMVRTFAGQVAVAVRTSRLFEMEYSSRREAEALRSVAEYLAIPADVSDSLEAVAELSGRLLGSTRSSVDVRDPESFGLRSEDFTQGWISLWDSLAAEGIARAGQPVQVDIPPTSPTRMGGRGEPSDTAAVLVPLLHEHQVTGVLVFEYDDVGEWRASEHAPLAGAIGTQVSLALENAFLFEQARRRASSLETVFRIRQTVSSSLQTKVVLNRVLDVVQKIFVADAVSLMTYEPAKKVLVTAMARGLISRDMLYMEAARGQDIPGRVFDTQQAFRTGALDAGATDPLERAAAEHGLSSLMSAPLLARGRSIGVITVLSRQPSAYDREEMELLLTFASQAALAIDAAQMYGREHSVASALQASLLPGRMPDLPGIEMSSEYRAASSEADIGGDYFDVFTARDGRVALVMGDVCGKGITAASKTSMIKYAVRSLVATGMSPGRVLATLNEMVRDGGTSTDIVTVWLGLLDLGTGALTYANGGHPPGLLRESAAGPMARLGPTGPLLGAIPGASYAEEVVSVPRGGTLLLYTDGVTEARRGNRFFGEGRVRRAMKSAESAPGIVTALVKALERFAPDGLRDDVAMLVVRRMQETEPVTEPGEGTP